MMSLPLHYVLEQIKSPMRNFEEEALFCIQCPDTFYMDLVAPSHGAGPNRGPER